jgi:hypothetical protein
VAVGSHAPPCGDRRLGEAGSAPAEEQVAPPYASPPCRGGARTTRGAPTRRTAHLRGIGNQASALVPVGLLDVSIQGRPSGQSAVGLGTHPAGDQSAGDLTRATLLTAQAHVLERKALAVALVDVAEDLGE